MFWILYSFRKLTQKFGKKLTQSSSTNLKFQVVTTDFEIWFIAFRLNFRVSWKFVAIKPRIHSCPAV